MTDDFFDFLRNHKLGFVLLDGYYMPHISEVISKHDVQTAKFSIVRLHGTDRQEIEERSEGLWNDIIEPKDECLNTAASIIKENAKSKITTYINVNNHYEGSAPLTIEILLSYL